MEIKYRISDGIVLEVKSHPTHILVAGAGEAIEEYAGLPVYAGMKRLEPNKVVPVEKVVDPVEEFDVKLFQDGLLAILPELSSFNLRLEFGALNTFAYNKDFAGMKQYMEALVANNIATADDYEQVSALLIAQGIDLETF